MKVEAVVHEPGACHPSPLQGRYRRDHAFFHEYHRETRTAPGFETWIGEWVTGVADRSAYLAKLGSRWRTLTENGTPSAPAAF
jgi:glutaconate CoA-transferase subunit A